MIDLGWAMARLELNDGKPLLTICWPATNDETAGSLEIFDAAGLRELGLRVLDFMDQFDEETHQFEQQDASLG
jgi:hypothetical protein